MFYYGKSTLEDGLSSIVVALANPTPLDKYSDLHDKFGGKIVKEHPKLREALRLVHSKEYLREFMSYSNCSILSALEEADEEFFDEESNRLWGDVVDFYMKQTSATIYAAEYALKYGRSANIGGGFHHATASKALAFSMLNDVAAAATFLHRTGRVRRVAVVDLDKHQGNGTAEILKGKSWSYTLSFHAKSAYPIDSEDESSSTRDVKVGDSWTQKRYLRVLDEALERLAKEHDPDFVFYIAGADAHKDDPLEGEIPLDHAGFRAKDRKVFKFCYSRGIPVCVVLGGGYNPDTTVDLHSITLGELKRGA